MANGPTSLSPEHLSRREESSYGKYFYHCCRHIWSGETSVLSKSQHRRSPSAVCQLLLLTARQKAGFSYLPTTGSRGGPLRNACPGASYAGRGLRFASQLAKQKEMKAERTHTQTHSYFGGVWIELAALSGEWDQTDFGVRVCMLNMNSQKARREAVRLLPRYPWHLHQP